MGKETHHYSNDEITVVWKPALCSHSTNCWKGLGEVFNPRAKPWINMQGASTEKIVEQIRRCPSGALSYVPKSPEANPPENMLPAEEAVQVQVLPNGPYLIQTECVIKHSDGREERRTGSVALCRCGASANKPFCDGSHRSSGFHD